MTQHSLTPRSAGRKPLGICFCLHFLKKTDDAVKKSDSSLKFLLSKSYLIFSMLQFFFKKPSLAKRFLTLIHQKFIKKSHHFLCLL